MGLQAQARQLLHRLPADGRGHNACNGPGCYRHQCLGQWMGRPASQRGGLGQPAHAAGPCPPSACGRIDGRKKQLLVGDSAGLVQVDALHLREDLQRTLARSPAALTLAPSTPGRRPTACSIKPVQAAQCMPLMRKAESASARPRQPPGKG